MIVTNIKKFNNFTICYGSLRKGDIIYHGNNDRVGVHAVFYGIRGDGYVLCPELNKRIHPRPLPRFTQDISHLEYNKLEYHGLSDDNLEYLMFIRRRGATILVVDDLFLNPNEEVAVTLEEHETILCFEGEATISHAKGSSNYKDLKGITASSPQEIRIKALNEAKLVRVKCNR